MKITHVACQGFRGYRDAVRVELAPGFTVIDGRNGAGKSTIFDAVEFALTGRLTKYKDATADKQSVDDYLWWMGEGSAPADRFVEVGFDDGGRRVTIRRTPLAGPDADALAAVQTMMVDTARAPDRPLEQLCASTIIRDEHIAGLSLDLKETARYALLRDAIGASDADVWIRRAQKAHELAKQRHAAARTEVTTVTAELAATSRRIDEVRSSLTSDTAIADAVQRLSGFLGEDAAPDVIAPLARLRFVEVEAERDSLVLLLESTPAAETAAAEIPELERLRAEASVDVEDAVLNLLKMEPEPGSSQPAEIASRARELVALIGKGERIGLVSDCCPLCAAPHDDASFAAGLARMSEIARGLDEAAASAELAAAERRKIRDNVETARRALGAIEQRIDDAQRVVSAFEAECARLGVTRKPDADTQEVLRRVIDGRSAALDGARRDMRVLGTLGQNLELERTSRAQTDARGRLVRAQERAGRARHAEAMAAALQDAAVRSAAETLDLRLDRVLPLMSELYRRLRPHPVWRDIDYKIRGDLRRFLSLRVGDDLNPQFLFSSGQRRATGLAFLLSINMSLAWSRWKAVLLDDPVQHVDDFRTVHLAEVMGNLVAEGRQIVCAVEDPALADLLCRRMKVAAPGSGRRVTLGSREDGSAGVVAEKAMLPLVRRALTAETSRAAG